MVLFPPLLSRRAVTDRRSPDRTARKEVQEVTTIAGGQTGNKQESEGIGGKRYFDEWVRSVVTDMLVRLGYSRRGYHPYLRQWSKYPK